MKTISGHEMKPETIDRIRREQRAERLANSRGIIARLRAKIADPPDNYGPDDIAAERDGLAELEANFRRRYGFDA